MNLHINTTLTLYVTRQFITKFAGILLGMSLLLLAFDLLANADEVLKHQNTILSPLLSYMGLRLPQILSLLIPIATLLGALIVFGQMVYRQEIVAMRSVGVPVHTILSLLLPIACGLALVQFAFANTAVIQSSSYLETWAKNDYRGTAYQAISGQSDLQEDEGWIAIDNYFITAETTQDDGRILQNVSIIKRQDNSLIDTIITAREARYNPDFKRWIFSGVQGSETFASLEFNFKPQTFTAAFENENTVSYTALSSILETQSSNSNDILQRYRTWLHYKIAHPLSILLMILICGPMAVQLARRSSLLTTGFVIILGGFTFLIAQSLFLSLGETGALPAIMAAWTPSFLMFITGAWFLLVLEG